MGLEIFAVIGFLFAAYSIVANDSIQTLGTFIASNPRLPWWVIWIFSSTVLLGVLAYGWYAYGSDVSYGRLNKFPVPEGGISWVYALPPVIIFLLTRKGIPVSTTFLILTVFNPGNIGKMLVKSALGYALAFVAALFIYWLITRFIKCLLANNSGEPTEFYWHVLQWAATAFLWSQWLIQDLANIYVYLPRQLDFSLLCISAFCLILLQGFVFFQRGGAIQKIVTSKTGTTDIKAATLVDFFYGLVLLVFKEWSDIPMSTTWVFLGLLAGRELAITYTQQRLELGHTLSLIGSDAMKALFGLLISIGLVFALPLLQ